LTRVKGEFNGAGAGGRCLVEDTIANADADVALSAEPRREYESSEFDELSRIQVGPMTVTITERRDHDAIPVEVKTTLVARYATIPFHFTATACGGLMVCLVIAREPFASSHADAFDMLAHRYGLAIARTPKSGRF
jgi:hypothetical protein